MNLSRRNLLSTSVATASLGLFAFVSLGCNTTLTQIVKDVNLGVTTLQGVMPILGIAFPQAAVIAPFLNLGAAALTDITNNLASGQTTVQQLQNDLTQLSSLTLSPTVIAQLPATINGVSAPTAIQNYVNAINALITDITARLPGTVVTGKPNDVVFGVTQTGVTPKLFGITLKPVNLKLNATDKAKLVSIKATLASIQAKLAAH